MKAVVIDEDNRPQWQDFETAVANADEVLIKVHATAINRADLMQRQGVYPPPPGASPILGLECAGEVVAVGENCSRLNVGDRVCALLAGGGYAQFASAHEGSVLPIPDGLSFVEAASLPEVFATAWLNLFMEANLQPGEKVILHAGASGVGTAAIQLCRSFGSATFITAGSDEKIRSCIELGADAGFNRHQGSFLEKAKEFAGDGGVNVVLDPVGGAYLKENLKLLALNGRLVLIGLMGGARAEIDLAALMMKRIRVIGSTLRARPTSEKTQVMNQLFEKVWPKIESGEIRPIIDATFPIEKVVEAHDLVSSDATLGKVVLSVT
jgi:putative PIG3 family NAD(P)H quinone oxidoreductase|tara:strand:- start:41 stop:1012 length:972 start_codon:yes stop_codon:yes gene_type:complete